MATKETQFDIIITGAGAAGLWSAYHLIQLNYTGSILLIDKETKQGQDHNWSFWAKEDESLVNFTQHSWAYADVNTPSSKIPLKLKEYKYYSTRSADFYQQMMDLIGAQPNIKVVKEEIETIAPTGRVSTSLNSYQANYCCLNSILDLEEIKLKSSHFLWQHFYGEIVKFDTSVFNSQRVGFMDFDIDQKGDCRFLYTLPYSDTEALIEYTVFSEKLLSAADYKTLLSNEISSKYGTSYEVMETELGKIPMCDAKFKQRDGKVINIGTAGGMIKASTGFGFRSIFNKTRKLAEQLVASTPLDQLNSVSPARYAWYDKLLLKVLMQGNMGARVFGSLFKNCETSTVFEFLDEKQSLSKNLKVILACPKWPFLKALISK